MNKFWKKKRGFTLIELLVVIGLLCILVLIAIPHFSSVRTRACNAAAKSALKNAYNAAQAFYTDSPAGTITTTILENYGYTADPNVNLNVVDGSPGSLSITAAYNQLGAQTYSIDFIGSISP
jgi:prepilin-type N-terminal cleavage/methylation domain-containing protein